MAAPRKKPVSKDDIRRLMKEKTTVTKSSTRKVDHPLAKYNSLHQLVCVLCNNVIKNDLLWPAHILSKQHKERALALKTQGPQKPDTLPSLHGKRKPDGSSDNDSTLIEKKRKTEKGVHSTSSVLPSDFFDSTPKSSREEIRERAKAALLAGYSSSSSSSDEEVEDDENKDGGSKTQTRPDSSSPGTSKHSVAGLPADFFDAGYEPPASESKAEAPQAHNKKMSEVLPEGFFDDPKMDAKVRKVEYKDKEEEEWELFKKTIKEEAQVSENIMEEEDEQVNLDRNIDEIDDQIQRWQEVENLHVKKEIILKTSKADVAKKDESDEDDDDEDLDDFLDWRAKKSIKKK